MFDDPEPTASSINPVWIEENIKKLYQERNDYRARWETLREWLAKRRHTSSWSTISMIERYMEELDESPPTWEPPMVPDGCVIGEEESE